MARKPKYIWHPEEVRALRKHLGMTQEELADELSCDQKTISYWENGHGQPKAYSSFLLKLAEESGFKYEASEPALLLP